MTALKVHEATCTEKARGNDLLECGRGIRLTRTMYSKVSPTCTRIPHSSWNTSYKIVGPGDCQYNTCRNHAGRFMHSSNGFRECAVNAFHRPKDSYKKLFHLYGHKERMTELKRGSSFHSKLCSLGGVSRTNPSAPLTAARESEM